ncbi:MAG TPA: SDR family oxidoreductase [Candidatus Omnitrophota bacterium]|jgi:3-oxoacyl-[acyl-carrier protein] reductase|nr:SDR family oxidoreductase [Candidatus Omnitrophota bacterium]
MNLKGKNAVITGASKGIGKAIALKLAEQGVNVMLAARTRETLAEATAEIQGKTKVKVFGVPTDVSQLGDLQNLVNKAFEEFKTIDILINNAGVSSQYPFDKQPLEDIERLAHTNYLGYVRLIRLVIPHMIERKQGAIINMVSGSTLCDPLPKNFLTYSSLKVGLRAFLKGLFWEMRDHGIKVTSILPGVVDTELTGKLQDIAVQQKARLMSAETVVDMVMFALSVPQNACPVELAVINQQTPWTKPVIDYVQEQAQ